MASSYTAIPKKDTYELIEKAKNGDQTAKEQIVNQNTGLVKNIALKFTNRGYELDDLLQIGFIGLLKAIDRFDTGFDVMFSTYAVPMILGEIKRYIRDDGRIKVSRQLKQEIKTMKQLREEYYNRAGYYPKVSELANEMEISVEKLLEIMEAEDALSSMESLDNAEKPQLLGNIKSENYQDEMDRNLDIIYLKSIISTLSESERKVIILRYFKDLTQQQIATKMSISQVQVSRIEKRVLNKLREKTVE